ncbi:Uncharacterized protein FWK35_00002508 [Aphis craccivora]|uniref:FLYWCH-type domain-containing protein n=1 Tax=Aphis craccivora TaxID=307492 RepID=A0A6G0ZA64_APHCR|nr:Uncharacterized protein FWK35_00002508 [Aphis craccivora]
MEIIKLNKGADKISYKGYMYTLKYAESWRCTNKSSLNCPAILKTSVLKTEPLVTTPHDHISEPTQKWLKLWLKLKLKLLSQVQIYLRFMLKKSLSTLFDNKDKLIFIIKLQRGHQIFPRHNIFSFIKQIHLYAFHDIYYIPIPITVDTVDR